MASKLDQAIARVAIASGREGKAEMMTVAAEVAATLPLKDIAKIPDRWYAAFSAKKAGASELQDPWHHLWFEALTEILVQKKQDGLPGLFILAERSDSTYHQFVIVRLLRLAAEGIETESILARLRQRLGTMHCTETRSSVREIVYWKQVDPKPLELLVPMSEIVCPNSDGDTVGLYIEQMGIELPVHLARMKEQGR